MSQRQLGPDGTKRRVHQLQCPYRLVDFFQSRLEDRSWMRVDPTAVRNRSHYRRRKRVAVLVSLLLLFFLSSAFWNSFCEDVAPNRAIDPIGRYTLS